MRDLPNLDFLRTCAVLSVVLEHVLLAYGIRRVGYIDIAWVGVVGVFLFFVHTSLVLMWSLERKPHTLDFYIRRVFRIYPLAIVAVLVTLGLHAPVAGSPSHFFVYQRPMTHAAVGGILLLVPNILGEYYPMSVLWSLPYEVEMYVVLPLLFFFLRENFSRLPLLLFLAFDIGICRHVFAGVPHNFFLAIPYFLPGVIAYVGFSRDKAWLPAWTFPLALGAAWALFLVAPGWRGGYALCLAVGLGLPLFHQMKTASLQRVSHAVAKYSYGLYLAHPFSLVLGLYLLPHRPLWLQLAIIVSSMVVFSVGAYHLLEKPMIRLGSRLAQAAERRFEQRQLASLRIAEADIQ